ncbi:MAG: hypothetical protein QXV13_01915 [Candidatus Micrarchaeaceae archaeon]
MLSIAVLVVLLGIFAIVAFVLSSMALFYLLAVLAIAIGFYLAYAASAESRAEKQASASTGKKRR